MRKNYIASLLIISLAALSGCSAISEEECLLGDWYQIGLSDGNNGKRNNSAKYSKECLEYQVTIDSKLYNEGRNTGLQSFCTYENGVLLGSANKRYNNVCPAELSKGFLSGYTPYHNFASAQESQSRAKNDVNRNVALLAGENLSSKDINTYKESLKSAEFRFEAANAKVSRYRKELTLHKIQVEMNDISEELATNHLSDRRKTELNNRLDTLIKQKSFYDGLSQAESTIRSIKGIADLF